MASKKISKPGINKSQWVRDQPANTPAAEVVAAAKKSGITITPAFVYSIRSAAKTSKASGPKVLKTGGRPGKVLSGGTGSIEAMLREIVRDEIRRYFTER